MPVRKFRTGLLTAAVIATLTAVGVAAPAAHADTQICSQYGSTTIQGGRYVVQNNVWGDSTTQCINVTSTGFSVTSAVHNLPQNGAPAAYPSVYAGCHYANCTSGSGLPMRVSDSRFATTSTSVSMSYPNNGSVYDASYDIWFDPTARTDGQNTGAELMVWLNRTGSVQPAGSKVGTASIAGANWDVWYGNYGWNVISYVRQGAVSSINFAVSSFYRDMVSRGYAQNSWYMTSVQAGFEPWVNGTGLAVNNFSYPRQRHEQPAAEHRRSAERHDRGRRLGPLYRPERISVGERHPGTAVGLQRRQQPALHLHLRQAAAGVRQQVPGRQR